MDVLDELGDVFDEFFKELGLFVLEVFLLVFGELDKVSPVHLQHTLLILLFLILQPIRMIDIQNIILLKHGTKLHCDNRLLLLDLIQSLHNFTKGINIILNIP